MPARVRVAQPAHPTGGQPVAGQAADQALEQGLERAAAIVVEARENVADRRQPRIEDARASVLARRGGHQGDRPRVVAGTTLDQPSPLEAVDQAYRKIYEKVLAIEDPLLTVESAVCLGDALSRLGRWEEAEHFATLADEHAEGFWRSGRVQYLKLRARLHAHKGELPEAERLARKALGRVLETDGLIDQAEAFMELAEVLEAAGRPAEAGDALQRALETYERKEHVVAAERARAALAGAT